MNVATAEARSGAESFSIALRAVARRRLTRPHNTAPVPTFRGRGRVGNWRWLRHDLLGLLCAAMEESGEFVRIPVMQKDMYLINDPALLREILVDDYEAYGRGYSHEGLRRIIGEGMLTAENENWVAQRRAAAPAFTPARLRRLEDIADAHLDRWIARWDTAATRGQMLALSNEFMALSAQVMLDHFFGATIGEADALQFVDDFVRTQALAFRVLAEPWWLLSRSTEPDLARIRAIAERLLPDAESEGLLPQAMTLLATAPENPSNTLAWTTYLLAHHPDAARRAQQAGTEGDNHYLRAVVHESIRLYPGAWGFERRTLTDKHLGRYWLPEGAEIMISPYTLHRNRRFWSDPLSFKPERFESGGAASSEAYMPFSAGPRKCVGDRFTLVVVMTVFRRFVARYRVRLDPRERGEMWPMFTLRPRTAMLARLERISTGA
jgi:cytochrome P450